MGDDGDAVVPVPVKVLLNDVGEDPGEGDGFSHKNAIHGFTNGQIEFYGFFAPFDAASISIVPAVAI